MKLVEIQGKIWELTCLWDDRFADSLNDKTPLPEKNLRTIQGRGWHSGVVRVLAKHAVKSKALAIIETDVNGLPHQLSYEIYHSSKGFYCNVQGIRVYLAGLID